ncbi:23S rRNA (pseudouridine(1915)-N(3))-methyltransferase RlmH [Acidaminobacterium chupaoyuni]
MVTIRVICVGKLKEAFYEKACAEYCKRLQAFAKLEIIELPEDTKEGNLAREAVKIRAAIPGGSFVIALCIEGKLLSSVELSEKIAAVKNSGISKICFLIGSSEGMEEQLKQQADLRLSMSPMTFPHHLARVMLLEQIYRALSIEAGTKYHK